ncbi:MAG: Nramp family divalent metal transporter [Myxococcota bacterium]|nr:Nramp family divalent metal transporter [Myxococcota bacterium]
MDWPRNLGPAWVVTAAFVGPGTVTTASVAGASFGHALLWAIAFSVLATLVLQEMSARLGVVTRRGLGEAMRTGFWQPWLRVPAVLLVVSALVLGNTAFEAGNVMGAALGLADLTGLSHRLWSAVVGVTTFALLASGRYLRVERVLVALVAVMAVVFLTTAAVARPDLGAVAAGALVPSLPPGALLTVLALIGTTVVPYNLFLHASAVAEKWPDAIPAAEALRRARRDTFLSIPLGGLVTFSIVVTAATFYEQGTQIESAATMARQLEPLLGAGARSFFLVGLLAAGLTSAITAPLAAAYAAAGALGWSRDLRDPRLRAVWGTVLMVGVALALVGERPVTAIVLAQAANGLLLPLVAIFLLVAVNRSALLGEQRNGALANTLGGAVTLVVLGLGAFQVLSALGAL